MNCQYATLTHETSVHTDDKTGREYLRFVPIVTFKGVASGTVRLACYEAWMDEPDTISTQRDAALESARESLAFILSKI